MTASQDARLGALGDELTVPDLACRRLTLYVGGASELSVPTLVKSLPLPERRLVGDLSETEKVLQALELSAGNAMLPEA
jgi:hypothetical protein